MSVEKKEEQSQSVQSPQPKTAESVQGRDGIRNKVEVDAAEFEAMKKELASLKKKPSKARKAESAASTSSVSSLVPSPALPAQPPTEEHAHEEGKPHYIGAWQHYCPTCGETNPDFKDETTCEDCGTHLGAKEVAEKLKACPNCGGKKAKLIKK